jgi:hypothetical protein
LRLLQYSSQPFADNGVIIDDKHSDHDSGLSRGRRFIIGTTLYQ